VQILAAAGSLAHKMEFNLSISMPKIESRRSSLASKEPPTRRKSALKSARAAAKAQMKTEGKIGSEDDIRVAIPPKSAAESTAAELNE
jgi:hypothetical protein